MCEVCARLHHPCLRCQAERIEHAGDRTPDVEWTPSGPRCAFCARATHRWGRGWVCGCGNGIDKNGETL